MSPCINKRVKDVLGNNIVTRTPAALTHPSSLKQSATYLTYKVFLSPFSQLISFYIPFWSPPFSSLWEILPHDLLLETGKLSSFNRRCIGHVLMRQLCMLVRRIQLIFKFYVQNDNAAFRSFWIKYYQRLWTPIL